MLGWWWRLLRPLLPVPAPAVLLLLVLVLVLVLMAAAFVPAVIGQRGRRQAHGREQDTKAQGRP
jgi:hypothetical protein